ncbi:MAG: hypothetical protein FGM47_01940 [Candidatus Nanopelagicaceae bacterium]|nr:hypothetical protein [Candidatus Nanopelagicaceae bacterium]
MRFLLSVVDTQVRSPHSPEEIAAIDAFNEKLVAANQRRLAIGLESPKDAVVVDARGGQISSKPGPLVDSNEFAAGIWIIEVDSKEQALELAVEGSKACNRKIELRPIIG